jgi:hypothetical protein
LFILIPNTNFYYNIKLHLNYLEINEVKDIFSYKFINRFIFSDRLTYLNDTYTFYKNSHLLEKFIGIGYINGYSTDLLNMKLIEMDLFDIFFRCGIFGFLIFLYPIILYFKDSKKNNNKLYKICTLSIIISFIGATLSGHTLVAPSISFYLVIIKNYRKDIKYASNSNSKL